MTTIEILAKIKSHLRDKQHENVKIMNGKPRPSDQQYHEAKVKLNTYLDIEEFLEQIQED